ncbi:MAG: hypothetical protein HWE14_05665 [Flavobacteriia bacterium]|nr:hypothetical protein [Flavobacteriia bacterium]
MDGRATVVEYELVGQAGVRWTLGLGRACVNGLMDGWTDGPMDRWTDGPMDGWTDAPTEGKNPERRSWIGRLED